MLMFKKGEIFIGEYPPEVAEWCNETGRFAIVEIEPSNGSRRFEIVEYEPTPINVPTDNIDVLDTICSMYETILVQQEAIDTQNEILCLMYEQMLEGGE